MSSFSTHTPSSSNSSTTDSLSTPPSNCPTTPIPAGPSSTSPADSTSWLPSIPFSATAAPSSGGAAFDCNICFDDVSEPVVTRCGHLFCWSCLHAWLQRGVFECPVCKAGVTQQNIIPLYGRGAAEVDPRKSIADPSSSPSAATPQRPRAERPQPPPPRRPNGLFGGNPFLTFNVFPLGIGFTFPHDGQSRQLTEEEQRAQLVSLAFLVLGFVILFYLLLI
eukprot:GHVS01045741.1.p1 GENE.GHVS01045741.1~~GHVS01045741.1.p1  ORF type:complete len:221 (-),score=39.11 GHVS01045741.1:295-957(-)